MLRGIHKASANWLGKIVMAVIMGLLVISFAVWGIGDIFRGFGRSTVAKVGDTEIGIEAFRQIYNDRLQQIGRQVGRPITPEQARALGLDRQVLGQVLAETALDERAREMGLTLSDAEIAQRITSDPTFQGITGQFDRVRFQQLIRQAGYSEARFVQEQRKVTLRQQIAGTVTGGVEAPAAMVDAFNRFENEERSVDYVLLDRARAGEIPPPGDDVLAKYFEERKTLFRAPEYRRITVLSITPAEIARWIEISDAEARKAFEERKASYSTPERRQLQQIVFPSADEARAAAERIRSGTPFAAVATERGLKPADIDLGLVAKSAVIDRAVADAAFALPEGGTSEPVQGRFGTVLVHVAKIEPGEARSYEAVAAELKRDLALERARNEVNTQHDKVEDERLAGGTLAEVAQRLGLQVRTIEAVDRSGRAPDGAPVPGLPQGADLLPQAFGAEVGMENEPLRVAGGGYVYYEVAEITPSRERPLEEVKARVEERWRDDEVARRLRGMASELLDKVKGGTALAEAAQAVGASVQTLTGLKRGTRSEALSPKAIDAVFRTPKDGVGSAEGDAATEQIVFRVTGIEVPKLDMNSAEAKRIAESLTRSLSEDLFGQYVARLEKDIGITVNQSALAQITGAATP